MCLMWLNFTCNDNIYLIIFKTRESGMGLKPWLNHSCMVKTDIVPNNYICDPFTLTGWLNFH